MQHVPEASVRILSSPYRGCRSARTRWSPGPSYRAGTSGGRNPSAAAACRLRLAWTIRRRQTISGLPQHLVQIMRRPSAHWYLRQRQTVGARQLLLEPRSRPARKKHRRLRRRRCLAATGRFQRGRRCLVVAYAARRRVVVAAVAVALDDFESAATGATATTSYTRNSSPAVPLPTTRQRQQFEEEQPKRGAS